MITGNKVITGCLQSILLFFDLKNIDIGTYQKGEINKKVFFNRYKQAFENILTNKNICSILNIAKQIKDSFII